ncbi:uncharacterized protein BO80DRAFT_459814 [Aspergillus ibericus CBS 121593]|uniref:Uncharacterized protein n=1 Tax=Aspergillus ibericus CBS 121593 TaxID=1448316 RepID=A0A395GJB3_9EURO|nr:hypothetical protein BO80DRAFT_459814 [Aspergillus ibericus CBS 121593]RAK95372.1 hypothetical protein BO80DRAFT_459814 [Aspergillus ibericus CBS 121593]
MALMIVAQPVLLPLPRLAPLQLLLRDDAGSDDTGDDVTDDSGDNSGDDAGSDDTGDDGSDDTGDDSGDDSDGSDTGSATTTTPSPAASSTYASPAASPSAAVNGELCSPQCTECLSNDLTDTSSTSFRRSGLFSRGLTRRLSSYLTWLLDQMRSGQLLAKDTSGMSSSETVVFGSGSTIFSQTNIRGCTVLMVVSKYAVYQAHLWEAPGFVTNQNGTVAFDEQQFQTTILDFLTNDPNLKMPQLAGSTAYPDAGTQVYIGTPIATTGQGAKYASQISEVVSTVNSVLGLSTSPTEYYYTTTNSDGEGKWLFKYNANTCNKPVWQMWYGDVADNALWSSSETSSCATSASVTPARTAFPASTGASTFMMLPKTTASY